MGSSTTTKTTRKELTRGETYGRSSMLQERVHSRIKVNMRG
jgi:hypothetical protein